jgi:hypothetical protein
MPLEDLNNLDGMYLVTGSGHKFTNKNINLSRLIEEWTKNLSNGP